MTPPAPPAISVCMPTYNGARYIREQIESILPQLSPDDELVVSDDGSKDATLEVIAAFHDPRIKVVQRAEAPGCAPNTENALRQASGDIVFLADQDDVWLKDKVRIMVGALDSCDLVVSDGYPTDGDLKVTHESIHGQRKASTNRWLAMVLRSPYIGCCMAFRRRVLDTCLPFPPIAAQIGHDVWLGNLCALRYRVTFIPDKLIYYRRHGNTASYVMRKSPYSAWHRVRVRAQLMSAVAGRLVRGR
jgi:glycosyltransferase involved in cell wall biosynthesis